MTESEFHAFHDEIRKAFRHIGITSTITAGGTRESIDQDGLTLCQISVWVPETYRFDPGVAEEVVSAINDISYKLKQLDLKIQDQERLN